MPSFESLFIKSNGRPIEYNGRIIQMVDSLSVVKSQKLKVVFVSANSDWRQGIRLYTDGSFDVNGQIIEKAILLWYDTAPHESTLTVLSKTGELRVKNVWDTGNGAVDSWHNGAAMIVEELPKGRLYKCNDGRPDDDFDDVVFSIEFAE